MDNRQFLSSNTRATIVALLNQNGVVAKIALALHLTKNSAQRGNRNIVVNADVQGTALDWSQQRAKESVPRLFGAIGLSRDTLPRETPEITKDIDHDVIDGPPRVDAPLRSALLAADIAIVPAQPSPFDGWASEEMLKLIDETRIFRPELAARFVLSRCPARTIIARETAQALAANEPPVLSSRIGQRVVFVDAARGGRLVHEAQQGATAAREIAALAAEIEGLAQ